MKTKTNVKAGGITADRRRLSSQEPAEGSKTSQVDLGSWGGGALAPPRSPIGPAGQSLSSTPPALTVVLTRIAITSLR